MKKRSNKKSPVIDHSISWERVSAIFGHPRPPAEVWERQFDYCDTELQKLAKTPYEEIDFADLWYYLHNLAYVELQPELFAYLFPVCLMDWHASLMENVHCGHGDADFHYGVQRGRIFEKMMTADQREGVCSFFQDSFLARLDAERQFDEIRNRCPTYAWIHRFNSLGVIMPRIDLLWSSWWELRSPGRAIAALQYLSDLMYVNGENPLFRSLGGRSPAIWANDSLHFDVGWKEENVDFLSATLTSHFVNEQVAAAVARLPQNSEWEIARQLERDLSDRQDLVQHRIDILLSLLVDPDSHGWGFS